MRHAKKGRALGTDASHTTAILRSLARAVLVNERIKTTEARAKEVRSLVEKIINDHMMLFEANAKSDLGGDTFTEVPEEGETILDTPIEELDLSVRSFNCLKRQGVNTIGQLTECTEADLLNIRNFGAKSIEEVKDKLQQMGLGLKG